MTRHDKKERKVNRRDFAKASAATAAALALGSPAPAAPGETVVVDDFQRPDSFYHGDDWESLNPGYWKLEANALRRRVHTRGDRARRTGFPFHRYMETEYDTRPPYGMIWRRDWKLSGNYRITMQAVVRSLPARNPEPGYSLMGVCVGGRSLYESWNGAGAEGDACWYAAWRDDGTFGVFDHTTDEAKPVRADSVTAGPAPAAGETARIEVEISGDGAAGARVTARLITRGGGVGVVVRDVDREKFLNGYFGLVGRGELDFEVTRVDLNPGENRPAETKINELLVCYPLGDSLRRVGDEWHCRFIALFRQEGLRGEIRIAETENPAGGWRAAPLAGAGRIVTNDFRRATAVIDCVLPADPSKTTLYYSVWKDGADVTADPRKGARTYAGRLPRLQPPYRLCGLSCHAINGRKPGMERTERFQENWIHDQPLPDAYEHLEEYDFQVMVWEDDIWYLELVLYPPSTDDAYKIITTTLAGPTTRWQMMRHWNVLNPGDHDHGMDDVKGPEQIAIRRQPGLGQDPAYMRRNFQIVQHLISGDDSPSGVENPKRWRRWKMPGGDFSLLIVDARLWRTSQDTHIWETEGWGGQGHVYDRKDPTRALLGEEQFAWLQETMRTDTSPLICVTGLNGMHTIWGPSPEAEQRNRVAADYAGWVKAACDRVIDLLSCRDGVVSVYGDVHVGSIIRNRKARLYECSFGPIGRTGGRRVKHDFAPVMRDYDGRDVEAIALFHQNYEGPDLRRQTTPGYWNFLEMNFDPRGAEPRIGLRLRRLNDAPSRAARGGGYVDVAAAGTGREITCRLPALRTLPNAGVRFATLDGKPIRGTRSLGDGAIAVAGLIGVAPGRKIVMTAHANGQAEARVVETLALG